MLASVAAGAGDRPRLSLVLNPAGGRMLLVLGMDVADLAATRFAISPLRETLKAVQLIARPDPPPVNQPWVRWARGQLDRRPPRLPRLWPLVVPDLPYWPDFLVPAPAAAAGRSSCPGRRRARRQGAMRGWGAGARGGPSRSGRACAGCSATAGG